MDELTASKPAAALPRRAHGLLITAAVALALGNAVAQPAQGTATVDGLQPGLSAKVRQLALSGSRGATASAQRVVVTVGELDSRLRLAPCQRIEPYLPTGSALWGKTRVGLRCAQGERAWNVFLPINVDVFGKAWVAAAPLSAGATLSVGDLVQAEVNLAEEAAPAITDADAALGRTLSRALNPGQALRQTDLKARQWFSAGDEVKVSARGSGFSVAGSGQALNHGLEGQSVRVRVESGRILVGMPVGERLVELPL